MGVIRWLVSVDAATWDRATNRIEAAAQDLLDPDAAVSFLREFDRQPDEDLLASIQEADDEVLQAQVLNSILEAAVSEQEWYLDKSLNQLDTVVRVLPDARSLLKIIDLKGLDVEPPEACRAIDTGLYGCCSPANMQDCLAVAERYPTPQLVQEALASPSSSIFSRLFGAARKAEAAEAILNDDYHAAYWVTLVTAIRESIGHNKMLGLGMST